MGLQILYHQLSSVINKGHCTAEVLAHLGLLVVMCLVLPLPQPYIEFTKLLYSGLLGLSIVEGEISSCWPTPQTQTVKQCTAVGVAPRSCSKAITVLMPHQCWKRSAKVSVVPCCPPQ